MPSQSKPQTLLKKASAGFLIFISGLNALGTIGVIGLMLLINADILGRAIFNRPIAGVPEMVSYSIVGIVFLQLAHTLRSGSLTRSDLLLGILRRISKPAYRITLAIFGLIGAGLLFLTLTRFWPGVVKAYNDPARNFMGNPGFFQIPYWPLYAVMAVGIGATVLQFLANAYRDLFGTDPDGLPFEEDASNDVEDRQ